MKKENINKFVSSNTNMSLISVSYLQIRILSNLIVTLDDSSIPISNSRQNKHVSHCTCTKNINRNDPNLFCIIAILRYCIRLFYHEIFPLCYPKPFTFGKSRILFRQVGQFSLSLK